MAERLAGLLEHWREDSGALRRRGAATFADVLDQCVGDLAEVIAANGGLPAVTPREPKTPDRLLRADEVAERLGTTRGWVYAHWQKLGCGRKLGRRTLRFSAAKLDRYLDHLRPHSSE